MIWHILTDDNPAPIRFGTKAQSGSDPAKKGQNSAPIRLRIRSMLISEMLIYAIIFISLVKIESLKFSRLFRNRFWNCVLRYGISLVIQ